MLRSLAYQYPNSGYETTSDQFLLGSDLLVAPCVKPGQASRTVVLPPGAWRDDEDSLHQGPLQIEVSTPLERLPHFIREV